jgi:hypothetical protein
MERDSRYLAIFITISLSCLFFFPVLDSLATTSKGYSFYRMLAVILLYIGLFFTVFTAFISARYLFVGYHWFIIFLFIIMMIWSVFVIFNGTSLTMFGVNQLFNRPDGAGPWIMPVIMALGSNVFLWKKINKLFIIHALIGISTAILVILLQRESGLLSPLEFTRLGLFYSVGYLFLVRPYQSKLGKTVGIAGLIAYTVIAIVAARRHALFTAFYFIIVLLYLKRSRFLMIHEKKRKDIFSFALGIILILSAIAAFSTSSYMEKKFDYFTGRMTTDTRTAAIKEFLNNTLGDEAFLLGRGALGTYKSRGFLDQGISRRPNIENGYLQIIHKGGIVLLILFLSLTIPAAYLGITHSSNYLSQVFGYLILGRLLDMIIYGLPWTDPSYYIFWLFTGACLNKKFRMMDASRLSSVYQPVAVK